MSSRLFFPLPIKAASRHWTLDQGVDIAAPAHTPLLAIGDGTIVGHGISGFGDWAPILKLTDGNYVYYGHAGPGNMVKDGTKVKGGQVIGEVGAGKVGISTGPHLEIGFAKGASGNPSGPQTAPTMRSILGKTFSAGDKGASDANGLHLVRPGQHPSDPVAATAGKVLGAAGNAAEDAAKAGFTWGFNQLWDAVGAKAEYAGLFVLLLGVGAWAAVSGLKRATRSPQEATA